MLGRGVGISSRDPHTGESIRVTSGDLATPRHRRCHRDRQRRPGTIRVLLPLPVHHLPRLGGDRPRAPTVLWFDRTHSHPATGHGRRRLPFPRFAAVFGRGRLMTGTCEDSSRTGPQSVSLGASCRTSSVAVRDSRGAGDAAPGHRAGRRGIDRDPFPPHGGAVVGEATQHFSELLHSPDGTSRFAIAAPAGSDRLRAGAHSAGLGAVVRVHGDRPDGCGAEPALRGGGVRAAGPGVPADLRRGSSRLHRQRRRRDVAAAVPVRHPVRSVHGLPRLRGAGSGRAGAPGCPPGRPSPKASPRPRE
jgi:hypothetical protein